MIAALCRVFSFIVLLLVGFHVLHSGAHLTWPWIGLAAFVFSFIIDGFGPPIR